MRAVAALLLACAAVARGQLNGTGYLLPANFTEGQDMRVALPRVGDFTEPNGSLWNFTNDQDEFELRMYSYNASFANDCGEYTNTSVNPHAPLMTFANFTTSVGNHLAHVEVERYGNQSSVNESLALAHVYFEAPRHEVEFVFCFRQVVNLTTNETDPDAYFDATHWYMLVDSTAGGYRFRAARSMVYYTMPEAPTAGQYAAIQLRNYEGWAFTPLGDACVDPAASLATADLRNASGHDWACLGGDLVKLVPKGTPCSYDPVRDFRAHPFLGSYYTHPTTGAFANAAAVGWFEGAISGGIAVVSTAQHNPIVGATNTSFLGDEPVVNATLQPFEAGWTNESTAANLTVEPLATGYIYVRFPHAVGAEYDVCISPAAYRLSVATSPAVYADANATAAVAQEYGMWRKLWPCHTGVDFDNNITSCAQTLEPSAATQSFSVAAETLTWSTLDLTPNSYGTIRVASPAPNLSRRGVPAAGEQNSSHWSLAGGDWVRVVPKAPAFAAPTISDAELLARLPDDYNATGAQGVGIGSFPERGCWPVGFDVPGLPEDEELAEVGLQLGLASRNLSGDPFVTDADHEAANVSDAYTLIRVPNAGIEHMVCYRRAGVGGWHVLGYTSFADTPSLWQHWTSAEYPPAASVQAALVPGVYNPPSGDNANPVPYMTWASNDTRAGGWGPLQIVPRNDSTALTVSLMPNTAYLSEQQRRTYYREWLDYELLYETGVAVYDTHVGLSGGLTVRLTPPGIACERPPGLPSYRTSYHDDARYNTTIPADNPWYQTRDAGELECRWEALNAEAERQDAYLGQAGEPLPASQWQCRGSTSDGKATGTGASGYFYMWTPADGNWQVCVRQAAYNWVVLDPSPRHNYSAEELQHRPLLPVRPTPSLAVSGEVVDHADVALELTASAGVLKSLDDASGDYARLLFPQHSAECDVTIEAWLEERQRRPEARLFDTAPMSNSDWSVPAAPAAAPTTAHMYFALSNEIRMQRDPSSNLTTAPPDLCYRASGATHWWRRSVATAGDIAPQLDVTYPGQDAVMLAGAFQSFQLRSLSSIRDAANASAAGDVVAEMNQTVADLQSRLDALANHTAHKENATAGDFAGWNADTMAHFFSNFTAYFVHDDDVYRGGGFVPVHQRCGSPAATHAYRTPVDVATEVLRFPLPPFALDEAGMSLDDLLNVETVAYPAGALGTVKHGFSRRLRGGPGFDLDMPFAAGSYFLCINARHSRVWKRLRYRVADPGLRWHLDAGEQPVNQAALQVHLHRCASPREAPKLGFRTVTPTTLPWCVDTDNFMPAPQLDAAKVVPAHLPCTPTAHVGEEGGGLAGIHDLSPGDDAIKRAFVTTVLPATTNDAPAGYRVCVSTAIDLPVAKPHIRGDVALLNISRVNITTAESYNASAVDADALYLVTTAAALVEDWYGEGRQALGEGWLTGDHAGRVWLSVPEAEATVLAGLADAAATGGFDTEPAGFGRFGAAGEMQPLTAAPSAVSPTSLELLSGAGTAFLTDVSGEAPAVAAGFWFERTDATAGVNAAAINAADVQFKLVPWPECEGMPQIACVREPRWCVWHADTAMCTGKVQTIATCRDAGETDSAFPNPTCPYTPLATGNVNTYSPGDPGSEGVHCAHASYADPPLAAAAPRGSLGLTYHLPEPGRYVVCMRTATRPWRYVRSGAARGTEMIYVRNTYLAAEADPSLPIRNMTLYDRHGVDGVALASWCGATSIDLPYCVPHFQPTLRRDYVAVMNATQVCMPHRLPRSHGWLPVAKSGPSTARIAPTAVDFVVPPAHPSPTGQYRLCALKVGYATDGASVKPGALTQAGVSYILTNTAAEVSGNGGGTRLLVTGGLTMLDVEVGGVWNLTEVFHVWDPTRAAHYRAVDDWNPMRVKSVGVMAGTFVDITVRTVTNGVGAGLGDFPVSVEQCVAGGWGDLTCEESTPAAFDMVNDPAGGQCRGGVAEQFDWAADGTRQFLRSGEVRYRVALKSACIAAEANSFNAGCGFKFVGHVSKTETIRSRAIWFTVTRRVPDAVLFANTNTVLKPILSDADPVGSDTTAFTCNHSRPCVLEFRASYRGVQEYAPAGNFSLAVGHGGMVPPRISGLHSDVRGGWPRGGVYTYTVTPYLLEGLTHTVPINVTFHSGTVLILLTVQKIPPGRLVLKDLVSLDTELGLTEGGPPAPVFAPQHGATPFDVGANWELQDGMHLEAMVPYELRFEAALADSNLTVSGLEDWWVWLEFDSGHVASRENRILSVPDGLTRDTARSTSPTLSPSLEPVHPVVAIPGTHTYRVQFRLFNNIGCGRVRPCRVNLRLAPEHPFVTPTPAPAGAAATPVPAPAPVVPEGIVPRVLRASLAASVRVKATHLRVHASQTPGRGLVREGVPVTVFPGVYDDNGRWLVDEYNAGELYALLTDSADGIATADGVTLLDTVGSVPRRHPMGWVSNTVGQEEDEWGVRIVLKTSRPGSFGVTFHTSSGLGPSQDEVVGAQGVYTFIVTDDTTQTVCNSVEVLFDPLEGATERFNLTVIAANELEVATEWATWTATVNPLTDFIRGGSQSAEVTLAQATALNPLTTISATMQRGAAVLQDLQLMIPPTAQVNDGETFRVRSLVRAPGVDTPYTCNSFVTIVKTVTPTRKAALAIHALEGGVPLCAGSASALGCSDYAVDVGTTLRLEVRYYEVLPDSSFATSTDDRDVAVVIPSSNQTAVFDECEGRCRTGAVELQSTHAPVTVQPEAGGEPTALSQGAAVVAFERVVTDGVSAPKGVAQLSVVQLAPRGFATPVREAVVDVCDEESLSADTNGTTFEVPCRTLRLWIRPQAEAKSRSTIIVKSSLPTASGALRPGLPGCENAEYIEIHAAAYYVWGDVRYAVYDVPLDFRLTHGSDQVLVDNKTLADAGVTETPTPYVTVSNGLAAGLSLRERLAGSEVVVAFGFFGLRVVEREDEDVFRVEAVDRDNTSAPLLQYETSRRYHFPPLPIAPHPAFTVLPALASEDTCLEERRLPRLFKGTYRRWSRQPGRDWVYDAPNAAVVGVPFPITVQVQTAAGERGWRYRPSPLLVRRVVSGQGGCNDGGDLGVYTLKEANDVTATRAHVDVFGGGDPVQTDLSGVVDLAGDMSSYTPRPERWALTDGGQRTLWVTFSAPCEQCALELSLCYQTSVATGVASSCLVNGATADEVLNGPVLANRNLITKPFTVRKLRVNQLAIVGQKVPDSRAPIAMGAPFSVTIEPMVEMAGGWLYDVSNDIKRATTDVNVYAEPRVRWLDGAVTMPLGAMRYGNGGFLRVVPEGAALDPTLLAGGDGSCGEAVDLKGLSATSGRRLLVTYASKLQLADLVGRGIRSAWWVEPLRFYFTRPCSRCEVYVRAWLQQGGVVTAEWQAPIRASDPEGMPLVYQVRPCGSQWIWGGHPPVYVQRRKPFSLTAWWADANGFPTWAGALPVSGGIRQPILGGTLDVTSPLTSVTRASLISDSGVATFRMTASRACWQCGYYVGDLQQPVIIASAPTRVIAYPRRLPYEPYRVDETAAVQQSDLFVFDMYLADELGDRAYLNPSYLPRLTAYQQEPQAILPISIRSSVPEITRNMTLHDRGGYPTPIQIVQRHATPHIVYGKYMANGIPVDPDTPERQYECGALCTPGAIAFTLRGVPSHDFELSHLDIGGLRLPVHLQGAPSPPRISWAVPPCCIVFNDTAASEPRVVSGSELTITMLIIGGIPGTDVNALPGNATFYMSTHALQHRPTVAITCTREGTWHPVDAVPVPGGKPKEYEWGEAYKLGQVEGGTIALRIIPVLSGDAEVEAQCTVVVKDVLPNDNAYVPFPSGGLSGSYVPEQTMAFTVLPGQARQPELWSWEAPWETPTRAAMYLSTLVGRDFTISLYGYRADGGPCAISREILGEKTLLSLEMVPAKCFVMDTGFTVGQSPRGPLLQWTGRLTTTSQCQIPKVRGLPSGEILQSMYSLSAQRRDRVELADTFVADYSTTLASPVEGGASAWQLDTGVENVITLEVLDALNRRVLGDTITTVDVTWARCVACCKSWYPRSPACDRYPQSDPPPVAPTTATAAGGVIRIPFTLMKGTDTLKAATGFSVVHIPWVVQFTVAAGARAGETLGSAPPIIASARAARLQITAALGERMEVVPHAVPSAAPAPNQVAGDADMLQTMIPPARPLRWVIGYTFDLILTAADLAEPLNVPRVGQQGADAKVTFAPAALPCHDVDTAGYEWCETCEGGAWNGTQSHLWSTCLAPPARTPSAGTDGVDVVQEVSPLWGTCEWTSFPQCSLEEWRIAGSKGFAAQSVVLNAGVARLPRTVYVGAPGSVLLQFSSDSLVADAAYTTAIVMQMQGIGHLEFAADFVASCTPEALPNGATPPPSDTGPAGSKVGRWERTVCGVVGAPFVSPPPVEPIQDENEVWYFPDRGYNHVLPADMEGFVGEGVLDIKIVVVETGAAGDPVEGDYFNKIRLNARCLDPDPEVRQRFYWGRVKEDLTARDLIVEVDPDVGWVVPVVGGVASFPRVGFHSICSETRLYADCVVDPSRDELRHCAGLHVELEPFRVGEKDAELQPPVSPPSAPPPPKTYPSVELLLGTAVTCGTFNPTDFAATMRNALAQYSSQPVAGVVLHHGCSIPASRAHKGIRSYDLDSSKCCVFDQPVVPVDSGDAPEDVADAPVDLGTAPGALAPGAVLVPIDDGGGGGGGVVPEEGEASPAYQDAGFARGVMRVQRACGAEDAMILEYLWEGAAAGEPKGTAAVRCCPKGSSSAAGGDDAVVVTDTANCTVARADGAQASECLPLSRTYRDAVAYCDELDMELCSARWMAESCCDAPDVEACEVDTAPAWVSNLLLTVNALNAMGSGVCTGILSSTYESLAAAEGYDFMTLDATQAGCAAACCAAGPDDCMAFQRGTDIDAAMVAPCTLKRPHPARVRTADPRAQMHFIYSVTDVTPSPNPNATAPPLPDGICDDRDENLEECEWPDRTQDLYDCVFDARRQLCTIAVYCGRNERVQNGRCVPCRGTTTREPGDEIHGIDTYCVACDGVLNGTAELDECGMCDGDNSACMGCDGVPNSGHITDPCGVCTFFDTSEGGGPDGGNASAPPAPATPVPWEEARENMTCRSCAVLPTVPVGSVVYRGPDWVYGDQDGGMQPGEVLRYAPCSRGGGRWLTVRWAAQYDAASQQFVSYENTYRAGCDGKYDLALEACIADRCPYASCPLAAPAGKDVCQSLGCLWDAAALSCTGTLAPHAMCACMGWSRADCTAMPECGWIDGECSEEGEECRLDERVANRTCVPCAFGLTNPAGDPVSGPDTECFGCDAVRGSGNVFDVCGVCGGDGQSCLGCDGRPNSGATLDECGVCGGDGACDSCAVTPSNARRELRVTHGPDWTGPVAKTAEGGFIVEMKEPCEGGFWYTVTWNADGSTGWYRVGCYGAYDLAIEACAKNVTAAVRKCSTKSYSTCLIVETDEGGAPRPGLEVFLAIPPAWVCRRDEAGRQCRGSPCVEHTARTTCNADVKCIWDNGSCGESLCADVRCAANVCMTPGACNPADGQCGPMTPQADGAVCDDGDDMSFGDACLGGRCTPEGVCVDDPAALESLVAAGGSPPAGYMPGMACNDTLALAGMSCETNVSGVPFGNASVCCATCVASGMPLPPGSSGTPVAAPGRGVEVLSDGESEDAPARHGTQRVLLQVPDDEEVMYFMIEMEVVIDAELTSETQDAATQAIYRAIASVTADRDSPLCTAYYDVCAEWDAVCNTTRIDACPVVSRIDPVDIPVVAVTPEPTTPVPEPTRPQPLTAEEMYDAGSMAAPHPWNLLACAAVTLVLVGLL